MTHTIRQCFVGYPNTSNFVKKYSAICHAINSTLFLVFGYPVETLSLALNILLQKVYEDVFLATL